MKTFLPKKILVVNMNYMGDALLTTPALSALRAAQPEARIDTIVGAGASADVLRDNPDVDLVIPRAARGSRARILELYRLLRRERYTEVIILPPLPAYAFAAWLARTPVRVGRANRGMDVFLTSRLPTKSAHMADVMLDTVPVAPELRRDRAVSVTLSPQEQSQARQLLADAGLAQAHPLVAVNMGATRPQKRWFAESFAATLNQLEGISCLLIGFGPDDVALAAHVQSLTRHAAPVNFVGRTDVKQLAALLRECDALLTADSGPMHLATAVGTPTVALFGSTDPAVTGPYDSVSRVFYKNLSCAPCGNHPTCDARYDCMREITPQEAALAVRSLLRERREMPPSLPMAAPSHDAMPEKSDDVPCLKSILIVTKFRFIGDTLLAIPIFRAARAQWPGARITLLTGRNARVLLQNNPYLDEIIEFDPNNRDRGILSLMRLLRRLRRERFDLCLTLNRSFHSALIPWLAGIKIRAGFSSEGRSFLLNRRVPYTYDADISEVCCYFDVLRSVAPQVAVDMALELWLTSDEAQEARKKIQAAFPGEMACLRLVGIQPGASLPEKRWPVCRFAAVAEALASDPAVRIVLLGGPDERDTAAALLDALAPETRGQVVDFVGKCDLRGSLALVSCLSLFVGNDTAIMHSAAALHVPTVALFGPTNPRKWGSDGVTHRVLQSSEGTMDTIPVGDVADAARALLSGLKGPLVPLTARQV